MHKICIVVNGYPTKEDPSFAFIRPLVVEFADNGFDCSVVAPQSFFESLKNRKKKRPVHWFDETEDGRRIEIFQPKYLSISNLKFFGFCISDFFRRKKVNKVINKIIVNPDVIYAHFWDSGIIAASVCGKVPVFVATGESSIWADDKFSSTYINSVLVNVKGVVAVSSKNLEESKSKGFLKYKPATVVLPNAFNPVDFFRKDKANCRKKLGYGENDFIIAFVGIFNERKGVARLVEAAKLVPNSKLILIGSGKTVPESDQIIFQGRVPHNEIVNYLSSADVFVLPTLAEGCCNAIVEAMACGLPIISSNLPFNDDILDDDCSIRINPNSIEEIADAIKKLKENSMLRLKMAEASLKKSSRFTIDERAKKIISFMNKYFENE